MDPGRERRYVHVCTVPTVKECQSAPTLRRLPEQQRAVHDGRNGVPMIRRRKVQAGPIGPRLPCDEGGAAQLHHLGRDTHETVR